MLLNDAAAACMQDRAFRIGQKRDVHVFRLIATGTLEELIYQRQMCAPAQACFFMCALTSVGIHAISHVSQKWK